MDEKMKTSLLSNRKALFSSHLFALTFFLFVLFFKSNSFCRILWKEARHVKKEKAKKKEQEEKEEQETKWEGSQNFLIAGVRASYR